MNYRQSLPSTELLFELFIPDFKNGKLYNKISRGAKAHQNAEAGFVAHSKLTDYRHVKIQGKRYMVHRILMKMYGENITSELEVDHKNHDGLDNRICNLSIVTKTDNHKNRNIAQNNSSGYTGISFNKRLNKWQSYIQSPLGKKEHLGVYSNIEEAVRVRHEKAKEYGYTG